VKRGCARNRGGVVDPVARGRLFVGDLGTYVEEFPTRLRGSDQGPASQARGTRHARVADRSRVPTGVLRGQGGNADGDTGCAPNQLTAAEISGYDAAVGKAIGVEPCFVEPPRNTVLAGNWNDRWDLAISSIGIARTRMDALYFTQPYFASSESIFADASQAPLPER
jgi:Bacterial extracellular solute-binding proteins, family 3